MNLGSECLHMLQSHAYAAARHAQKQPPVIRRAPGGLQHGEFVSGKGVIERNGSCWHRTMLWRSRTQWPRRAPGAGLFAARSIGSISIAGISGNIFVLDESDYSLLAQSSCRSLRCASHPPVIATVHNRRAASQRAIAVWFHSAGPGFQMKPFEVAERVKRTREA
jgi:hypothetical protein